MEYATSFPPEVQLDCIFFFFKALFWVIRYVFTVVFFFSFFFPLTFGLFYDCEDFLKETLCSLKAFGVCFIADSELIKLAGGDLLALKRQFEILAVEETLSEEYQTPAVIGGVFVCKALAGICLQACKDRTDEPDKLMIASKYYSVIQRLLHSCEYEVRSVVLEFFLSQLSSEPNNSLQCGSSLGTTCSTTECSLISFGTVHFNTQLFTMAIKEEQHVDCLVKVN